VGRRLTAQASRREHRRIQHMGGYLFAIRVKLVEARADMYRSGDEFIQIARMSQLSTTY